MNCHEEWMTFSTNCRDTWDVVLALDGGTSWIVFSVGKLKMVSNPEIGFSVNSRKSKVSIYVPLHTALQAPAILSFYAACVPLSILSCQSKSISVNVIYVHAIQSSVVIFCNFLIKNLKLLDNHSTNVHIHKKYSNHIDLFR